tara:strand:- start:1254 stop:2114 length:861 start_codon:yes stop_codon:yes gene_type:complete
MATTLSPAFVTLFEAEVHQAYQASAMLRNVCRMRTGVEGSTAKFPSLAKGTATERTPSTDVVPLNGVFSTSTATLLDYVASEYSDIFNQAKINFDERQELAQLVGSAIGRREDQIILDALTAATPAATIANTVVTSGSASASDLNVGKIIAAKKTLDAKNVPAGDRHLVIHANSMASLLGDERAVSADYAQIKALSTGDSNVNQFLGFTVHMLGDRDEGGLAIDGSNDRTCFAFHKSSIGCAVGISPKTEINYVPEKTSFLVTAMLSMGAVSVDGDGQVDITCRES